MLMLMLMLRGHVGIRCFFKKSTFLQNEMNSLVLAL